MSYDKLYTSRKDNILWGHGPGRLILNIDKYLTNGTILDAGCGDGKNALYLEQNGFSVVGFDKSKHAIKGLFNRFRLANREPLGIYEIKDLDKEQINGTYDALVSYGLFHCMSGKRVKTHLAIQHLVRKFGYMFFTCLTDILPLPENHGTKNMSLVGQKEIDSLLSGWKTVHLEKGVIKEDHMPVIGPHEHSAIWVIARKDY